MKIAVPTRNNVVDEHFGHCEFYTIFNIENNKIINSEILPSPQGCGCKSNIAAVLNEMGVTIMLAGGMGQGAVNVLTSYGIDVLRGCSGDVRKLTEAFLEGLVNDSGESCHQHEHHNSEGHQCNH
jgi:predicted Fe-Mo cluster-binding NifX family protein